MELADFDLVGDATRNVGPRAAALRRHQVRDVVERDDKAFDPTVSPFLRNLNVESPLIAVTGELNLATRRPPGAFARFLQQLAKRGDRLSKWPSDEFSLAESQSRERRTVDEGHPSATVEAYDACRNTREDSLSEAAPLVDLVVRHEKLAPLRAQLTVISLKVDASELMSPVEERAGTCTSRLPEDTCCAAAIKRLMGDTKLPAKPRPIQMADSSTTSATPAKTIAKATCTPKRLACSCSYSAAFSSVSLKWRVTSGSSRSIQESRET